MNNFKPIFQLFLQDFTHGAKLRATGAFLVVIFSSTLAALSPPILARITDKLSRGGNSTDEFSLLLTLAFIYLAAIAIPQALAVFALYAQSLLRLDSSFLLSRKFFVHLLEQSQDFYLKKNPGELGESLNQANNDLYIIIRNLLGGIISPLAQLFIAGAALILSRNWEIAAAILVYALLFFSINSAGTKKLLFLRKDFMEADSKSYGILSDSASNLFAAKQYNGLEVLLKRYSKILLEGKTAQQKYWSAAMLLQACNFILFSLLFGFSFLWALQKASQGQISIGSFVMIASYVLMLISPIENLGQTLGEVRQSIDSFFRFFSALKSESHGKSTVFPDANDIAFELRDVSAAYEDTLIFENLSLVTRLGEKIVLFGPSGSGKSSLVKVLTNQIKLCRGSAKFRGKEITSIDRRTLNEDVGLIGQDVFIFKDTLRFNLQIAREDASEEEMIEALRKANLFDYYSSLPCGLETEIGDRGFTLSGGQRQRLSLARLFLRTPKVIIIDEGTSALDLISEEIVLKNLLAHFSNATLLFVSHRPALLDVADRLLVLKNGMILDHGAPGKMQNKEAYLKRLLDVSE